MKRREFMTIGGLALLSVLDPLGWSKLSKPSFWPFPVPETAPDDAGMIVTPDWETLSNEILDRFGIKRCGIIPGVLGRMSFWHEGEAAFPFNINLSWYIYHTGCSAQTQLRLKCRLRRFRSKAVIETQGGLWKLRKQTDATSWEYR